MKRRPHTIKLESGDVRALRVIRGKRTFRLVIYDEDSAVPLIQAKLNPAERQDLQRTLASGN